MGTGDRVSFVGPVGVRVVGVVVGPNKDFPDHGWIDVNVSGVVFVVNPGPDKMMTV